MGRTSIISSGSTEVTSLPHQFLIDDLGRSLLLWRVQASRSPAHQWSSKVVDRQPVDRGRSERGGCQPGVDTPVMPDIDQVAVDTLVPLEINYW